MAAEQGRGGFRQGRFIRKKKEKKGKTKYFFGPHTKSGQMF
jgi:hypothetical protein